LIVTVLYASLTLLRAMNIQRPKNTKEKGVIEFLVYKEANTFIGVCLTFDILEEGKDPTELMNSLREAASLHLETAIKNNLSDDLLNRYAPEKHWKKYFEVRLKQMNKNEPENNWNNFVVSPYYSPLTRQVA